jgi:BASS family bile acid:Na+ symporter
MSLDQIINLLATVTLIEMMLTIGLGASPADILAMVKNRRCVLSALLANYICVPAAAMALYFLLQPPPMVAAGILICAVCPGAPYGPPFNSIAKGNVASAVGLMVILAGTSAILAPLLLMALLPMLGGKDPLHINVVKMVSTLVLSQFLPLAAGLFIRVKRPATAEKLKNPAGKLSALLNLVLLASILATQFTMLLAIRPRGYMAMFTLVLVALAAGWLLGGPSSKDRKTLAITTAVRNVGVGLVIATSSFPGTAAITTATAFAIFQTVLVALLVVAWGRISFGHHPLQKLPTT